MQLAQGFLGLMYDDSVTLAFDILAVCKLIDHVDACPRQVATDMFKISQEGKMVL